MPQSYFRQISSSAEGPSHGIFRCLPPYKVLAKIQSMSRCLSTSIAVFTGTCSKTKRESEGGGDQGAEARSGGHSNC